MPLERPNPNLAQYLTVSEAAGFLGVSPWTLRNWDKTGKLKSRRHPINGYRIYRPEDLAALLGTEHSLGKSKRTLTPGLDWSETAASDHFVQFYETDAFLMDSVSAFIGTALEKGEAAIVIASRAHRNGIQKRLRVRGLDVFTARERGQYALLDASEILSKFIVGGFPDRRLFNEIVGGIITKVAQGGRRVRAFGEMVALLWAQGSRESALQLEEFWDDLGKIHSFALFCAYPLAGFAGQIHGKSFCKVCAQHARVIPAESYIALSSPDKQLRAIALLQQKALSLEADIAKRKE